MNIERLSLDQLRVLLMVAESGSFSATARRLGRVQSAVSYSIQQLELQLGVTLFERVNNRPVLNAMGRSIVEDARVILARADSLLAKAAALSHGLESEVSLTVDVMVPFDVLARVLREFDSVYPTVRLRLQVEALGAVAVHVRERVADLGVLCSLLVPPADLTVHGVGEIKLVPVVAPEHPLAAIEGVVSGDQLTEYVQLVLTDRSDVTAGQEFSVHSPRTWRVSDLSAKLALLRAGLGFGNMPTHMVAEDLERGRLKILEVSATPRGGILLPIFLAHRADVTRGPALTWLMDRLRSM